MSKKSRNQKETLREIRRENLRSFFASQEKAKAQIEAERKANRK